MAASETNKEHIPGVLGGDLSEKERDALEEGQDADISSKQEVGHSEHESLKKEAPIDSEKGDGRDVSSTSSEDGVPADRDLEKAEPAVSEKPEDQHDPNVVDWDGPEDPQNPYNWYVISSTDRAACHFHWYLKSHGNF